MTKPVRFQKFWPGDEKAISRLIHKVFTTVIAPEYSAQGVQTFTEYISPEAVLERQRDGRHILL